MESEFATNTWNCCSRTSFHGILDASAITQCNVRCAKRRRKENYMAQLSVNGQIVTVTVQKIPGGESEAFILSFTLVHNNIHYPTVQVRSRAQTSSEAVDKLAKTIAEHYRFAYGLNLIVRVLSY